MGYQTPEFANAALRALASDWRVSGILQHALGRPDQHHRPAGTTRSTASRNQRLDKVSDDVYGAKTLTNYLNPAAFAQPATGTLGNLVRYNSGKGRVSGPST